MTDEIKEEIAEKIDEIVEKAEEEIKDETAIEEVIAENEEIIEKIEAIAEDIKSENKEDTSWLKEQLEKMIALTRLTELQQQKLMELAQANSLELAELKLLIQPPLPQVSVTQAEVTESQEALEPATLKENAEEDAPREPRKKPVRLI
jgi:putative NADH-flavin reductase